MRREIFGYGSLTLLFGPKDFDTWGITPPFSFTTEDHRPTNRARFVMVKGGKIVQMREVSVDRDMKWIGK